MYEKTIDKNNFSNDCPADRTGRWAPYVGVSNFFLGGGRPVAYTYTLQDLGLERGVASIGSVA